MKAEKKKDGKTLYHYAWILLGAALLFLYVCENIMAYNSQLVKKQENEFLRLAGAMTYTIKESLEDEKRAADLYFSENVTALETRTEELDEKLAAYIRNEPELRNQVLITDEKGNILADVRNEKQNFFYEKPVFESFDEYEDKTVLGKAELLDSHEYGIPVLKPLEPSGSRYAVIFLNMKRIRSYLNQVMENNSGKSYAALKTQEGYIISHKNQEQVGMHMVKDRKKMYPDLDLTYLEDLEKMQLSGKESTCIYDSYWFSEGEPQKPEKKYATFTPLYLDHEFWVLTLNLEYRTYMRPMQIYMAKSLVLCSGIFILIGWLLLRIRQFWERQQKILRENEYLQNINQMREELSREREQLLFAEKLGEIGTMTSRVVHDMRNFLHPILGHAEFIADNAAGTDDIREDAQSIICYAEKASALTEQISRFAHRKPVAAAYQYLELEPIWPEWVRELREMIPLGIIFQIPEKIEPVWIFGNKLQLEEILINLTQNAVYSMKDTGGVFTIEYQVVSAESLPEGLKVSLYDREFVKLSVTDTGCGMSEDVREHIFDAFFTTKPQTEGTGLGLSNVRDFVICHGGDIRVESEPGRGTSFFIYLPVKIQPVTLEV